VIAVARAEFAPRGGERYVELVCAITAEIAPVPQGGYSRR
jgi:hypothetical protein